MRSSSFLYIFPAPTSWGTRTAAGGFAPDGAGSFSLNLSGGIRRLRTAGASRRPPRGQKGRTTCGFPSSLNSYLSLASYSGADCRHVTASKRSTAEDFFFRIFLNLFAGSDSILLHRPESLRRRDITVSRNSLARCTARHLRIRHLVQFILVGAVYHNALTSCAARLCRACVE